MKHLKLFEEFISSSDPVVKMIEVGLEQWDKDVEKTLKHQENHPKPEWIKSNVELSTKRVHYDFTEFVKSGDLKKLEGILKKWGFAINTLTQVKRTGGWDVAAEPWEENTSSRADMTLKMIGRRKLLTWKGYNGGWSRNKKRLETLVAAIRQEVIEACPFVHISINEYSLEKGKYEENDDMRTQSDRVLCDLWLFYSKRGESLAKELNIGEE